MSAKEQVIAMIEELPNDVDIDDIEYHLYVRRKIMRGLDDIRSGRVLTHEEVENRFKKWRTS
jgi:predicted transcriptional regulator